ncbi:unnamed protein product, partial [Iphiclides podalirius]
MITLPRLALLLAAAASLASASVVTSNSGGNFELLILHNNDMHARFEQTSQLSGACTTADREAGKCYGGFPRVAYVVKEARRAAASGEGPPVLYLNAGDTYTGTAWFTIYKWKVAAEFLNALKPDAVCLGNHEFDEEVGGVVPFIKNLTSPVLAANLILDKVPELQNITNLYKSIVLTRKGIKIGIIGYLTPDTKFLAPKNDVEYEDEITAISREVAILREKGVNIIIALGHSGFLKDLEIAKEVDGLDLVIGGHSNTFLWNGESFTESPEHPQGLYPTIVKQKSGRTVPVVQAYAYTKYLGKLHLFFDASGKLLKCFGDPMLLHQEIPNDEQLMEIIKRYRKDIDRINNEVVGSSLAFLDGEQCRIRECNLGNIITDSILNYTNEMYDDVKIAVIQGGRIRASLGRPEPPFNITRGDLITILPFSDTLTIITMNGSVLLKSLEHSVASWRTIDSPGQFLQMSGVEVIYDLSKPSGHRVQSAKAMCIGCSGLGEIQPDLKYKIILPGFLADGGDGYSIFENLPKDILPYNEQQ